MEVWAVLGGWVPGRPSVGRLGHMAEFPPEVGRQWRARRWREKQLRSAAQRLTSRDGRRPNKQAAGKLQQ